MTGLILMILATLPTFLLMIFVYKQDKVEKEPIGMIFKLLGFGALSVIPAMLAELLVSYVLELFLDPNSIVYIFLDNFVVVAMAEEGVKMLAAKWGSYKNINFNYRFDGVIYCISASMGFAVLENILYVLDGGISTAILRAFTAIIAHGIFGLFMGIYYGEAKYQGALGNKGKCRAAFLKAYFIPVAIHGLYDFSLSVESVLITLLFWISLAGLYVWAFFIIRKASKTDVKIPFSQYNGAIQQPMQQPQNSAWKFDPQTGKPLAPQTNAWKFDPQTGKPLQPQYQQQVKTQYAELQNQNFDSSKELSSLDRFNQAFGGNDENA